MSDASTARDTAEIRSVGRAIDLIQALNRRPRSSLQDLVGDLRLPKSTLTRLLRTLETLGFVEQPSYGTYQLLGRTKALSSGFHHEPLIVEVAEELMIDFTRREGWPLAVALFDLNAMVVRACTSPHTSLSLDQSMLNRRLGLIDHALGRAYVACSAPIEQRFLLEIVRNGRDRGDRGDELLVRTIDQVRTSGYAIDTPQFEARSSGVAVPIREEGRVVASLGLTWITAAMPIRAAIDRFVPMLTELSAEISSRLL